MFSISTSFIPTESIYEPLALVVKNRLPNFSYQIHFAPGEFEQAVRSKEEIRQFLNNIFGARTPEGEVAFSANGRINLVKERRVGRNKLLDDEEINFYVNEYTRHDVNGPIN